MDKQLAQLILSDKTEAVVSHPGNANQQDPNSSHQRNGSGA